MSTPERQPSVTSDKTDTPTPRTDKVAVPHIGFYSCATVPADFARGLERELAAMQEDRDRMVGYINAERVEHGCWRKEADEQTLAIAAERDQLRAELAAAHAQAKRYAVEAGQLAAQLSTIEQDGTKEHNAAVQLRHQVATLRGVLEEVNDYGTRMSMGESWCRRVDAALADTAPEDAR